MVVKIDAKFNRLMKKFLPKFLKALNIDWGIGSAISINNAKVEGKKTKMNPINLTKQQQKANIDIIENLIKDVNSDVSKKINYLVNKNISERGSNEDLAKDLKNLFDKDVTNHFTYKNRFKTIARTESTRILSDSSRNTALRLGAKKKYLIMVDDDRTSDISKAFNKKYGMPEQAIPTDKKFSIKLSGKEYSGLDTPLHINDRDQVIYIFD